MRFSTLVLCSEVPQAWVERGDDAGLESLQKWLEGPVVTVKAVLMAGRNKKHARFSEWFQGDGDGGGKVQRPGVEEGFRREGGGSSPREIGAKTNS